MTEDKMVGWHHWLKGHEFEKALGDGEGQGSLVCCSPWGRKESDTTKQLNKNGSLALFPKTTFYFTHESIYSYIGSKLGFPGGWDGKKNLPAIQETWVQSLGWENPLGKEMAIHSSILAWWIPKERGAWQAIVFGVAKSRIQLND